jgi:hypothetical protein
MELERSHGRRGAESEGRCIRRFQLQRMSTPTNRLRDRGSNRRDARAQDVFNALKQESSIGVHQRFSPPIQIMRRVARTWTFSHPQRVEHMPGPGVASIQMR